MDLLSIFGLKRKEWFTPEELGYFDFPRMKRVYVGKCGGKGSHDYSEDFTNPLSGTLAHTHSCGDDPLRKKGVICVRRPHYITALNGLVMWHEYAHIIDEKYVLTCVDKARLIKNGITIAEMTDYAHGPSFRKIMEEWGKDPSANVSIW